MTATSTRTDSSSSSKMRISSVGSTPNQLFSDFILNQFPYWSVGPRTCVCDPILSYGQGRAAGGQLHCTDIQLHLQQALPCSSSGSSCIFPDAYTQTREGDLFSFSNLFLLCHWHVGQRAAKFFTSINTCMGSHIIDLRCTAVLSSNVRHLRIHEAS